MNRPSVGKYEDALKTIDSHTEGESTRIIYDGFPDLPGETMMDKKKYLMEHYDKLRCALMLEPRGHRDMFGAVLTQPVHGEADTGVIFLDSGGCLNMCGHGSIGTASMLVETHMVPVTEPYTTVVLDAPSGVIRTRVKVEDGHAVEASIVNVPAFLYKENLEIEIPGYGRIPCDISFGGSFFALVNADAIGLSLEIGNIEEITDLGMKIREKINDTVEIRHPYLDITTVDLVEFYGKTKTPGADMKNCVIFGNAQADRSPCGTGTSAKLAALYAKGKMQVGGKFVYESITGSLFTGEILQEVDVGGRKGVIPRITGSAHITGMNDWIIDERDALRYGFLLGSAGESTEDEASEREKIVDAAWELFREKGYETTSSEDIAERAGVSLTVFRRYFHHKEDLSHTLGELFDRQYSQLLVSMDGSLSASEKLLQLNQEMFRMIEEKVPFHLVSHVYVGMQPREQDVLNEKRFYYRLIPSLFEAGIRSGEFPAITDAEEAAKTYETLERGLIYDWCVRDGKDSLTECGSRIIRLYLQDMQAKTIREDEIIRHR